MVFEPIETHLQSLVGSNNALRLPINIEIERRRPLTTKMWEMLFLQMEDAALSTDLRLYKEAMDSSGVRESEAGFQFIVGQTDRFVVTSISRGSIEITAAVLLAAGWAYKEFIKPGWEKSGSKKALDDGVAAIIDKSIPILKDGINARVLQKLNRLNIRRISFRARPNHKSVRLADNSTFDTELVYDKPKYISHHQE